MWVNPPCPSRPTQVTRPHCGRMSHCTLCWWQQTTHKPQLQSTSLGAGDACHHVQAGTNRLGSSHPLHHSPVLKQLLPRESWHGTAEHSCGVTAHGTQSTHPAPTNHCRGTSGKSHFQDIPNTVLTSPWHAPRKVFVGYMDQTQGALNCFKKQNLLHIPPPLLKRLIIYVNKNKIFTVWFCLNNGNK